MLNENLLNPKDREIVKLKIENECLKKTIQSFKEYDEERKQYYSALAMRVGELESYIEELEHDSPNKQLMKKNKAYKEQLQILNARAYLDKFEIEDIKAVETASRLQLREKIKQLNKRIIQQKNVINDLLYQINQNSKMTD